jgi:hypothetical protein
MEGSSECIKAVGDSRQGVVLQIWCWMWGLGLTTLRRKNQYVRKCHTGSWTWTDSLERPKQRKMDMRFGTCKITSLYRSGTLKTG